MAGPVQDLLQKPRAIATARAGAALGCLVFFGLAAGCSSSELSGTPPRAAPAVEISPVRLIYHGGVPAQFRITNVGSKKLETGMCAAGLQLLAPGRWIDVPADGGVCVLALLSIAPGASQTVAFGLDERLPDGMYRGRFNIWESGSGAKPLPEQFSEPFTFQRRIEQSIQ